MARDGAALRGACSPARGEWQTGMPGNTETIADDVLYESFLQGDDASYDRLMLRYGDPMTIYLHGIVHDWHDAEDTMIEAFAKIMVKKPRIREGCFKAYLFKTGRNLAIRLSSKKRAQQGFSLDGLGTEPSAGEYLEEHVVGEERKQALHLCLERIDPQLKEAMWLFYFEDMSYAQAAEVLKVSAKKVDYLLQRAKKVLRAELEREGVHGAYS